MRKGFCIGMVLVLLVSVGAGAKGRFVRTYDSFHYFTTTLGGGYSSLLNENRDIKVLGGGGALGGVGYELRVGNFWLGAGFEAQYLSSSLRLTAENFSYLAYDTEGDQVSYHYAFDVYRDWQHTIYLNAPIMLGYISGMGIYGGVGVKVGGSVFADTYTKVDYTTTATYGRYIDDFVEMPNHYYTTFHSRGKGALKFVPSVSVTAEVGYDLFKELVERSVKFNGGLKLGVFAEMGVRSVIDTERDGQLMWVDSSNVSHLNVVPFYTANSTKDYRILPLFVGVKVSFLVGLPKKDCFNCNWYNEMEE